MTRRRDASVVPDVLFLLLVANGLAFAMQNLLPLQRSIPFMLFPVGSDYFRPWQILTHAFMHGDLLHLAFNMLMLWIFGADLERILGAARFAIYYLVCVLGAVALHLLIAALTGDRTPMIGASGGVYGILLAFGMAFPNRIVVPVFPPVPMRAITAVLVFGGLALLMGLTNTAPGIAHFAHVGGMLSGFLLIQYWRYRGGRRR